MQMSESIAKLATALAKAQSEMEFAKKDKANDYFKSKYSDLASCIEVSKEPLSKNGLAVVQTIGEHESGIRVETILMHTSGEWIRGDAVIPLVKKDPQALGSAVTYGRRYSLCAIINLAADDDDGEAAMNRSQPAQTQKQQSQELAILSKHIANVTDAASANTVLRLIGKASNVGIRNAAWAELTAHASTLGVEFDRDNKAFIQDMKDAVPAAGGEDVND